MTSNVSTLSSHSSSSRRALIIALVCGAIAALLVFAFLNRSSGGTSVASTPVLVAAQNIGLGQEINDTNVTVRTVATADKHPLAILEKDKAGAIGQVALEPLAAGQQILTSEITKDKAQVGLAARIPAGDRAIAISVDDVTTGGGFVMPGDHVDVIGTFQVNATAPAGEVLLEGKSDSGNKRYAAVTILQNVTVLAIGQSAVQPQQSSGNATGIQPSAAQAAAKSVTLALSPDEAQKIFLAEEIGTLRLAERPLGDKSPVQLQPADNSLQNLPAQPGQ